MKHWLPTPQPLPSFNHVNELGYQAVRRALFPTGRRAIRCDANAFKWAKAKTTASLAQAVLPSSEAKR